MYDVAIINLRGHDTNVTKLRNRFPHAQVTRYLYSHEQTINRCLTRARTTHVWVITSCCDYTDFDFDWEPLPWESKQIHCWASNGQKYGDTFLIPVEEWNKQQPEWLHWFHDINYHEQGVPRLNWPASAYGENDLTQTILDTDFASEYQWFAPEVIDFTYTGHQPALWGEEPHQLISFSTGNTINLVPRRAKDRLKTQVYDYARLCRYEVVKDPIQDIIFISYDEPHADENWAILKAKFPQAVRVDGVEGMENALKEAANWSRTTWFYAVFAKTRLHEDWDFSFQPDRWQSPKHYIFNSINTSNDLVYGHMGMILYHKGMVLNSREWMDIPGMDYTMSFPTESIPLTSVYGDFATTPYHAWRTAFREVSKLCQWQLDEPSVETDYRIHVWRTRAHGPNADWVLLGANDGAMFYAENITNHDELKMAFRWEWLKSYFQAKYGPDLLP